LEKGKKNPKAIFCIKVENIGFSDENRGEICAARASREPQNAHGYVTSTAVVKIIKN
jgi:hypothetical protein